MELIGYINAQITGMRYYNPLNKLYLNDIVSFSRSNDKAIENRKFDVNSIAVVNSHNETIGSIAKDFARYLAPLMDESVGIFEGSISKIQTPFLEEAYHQGEQCDLKIDIYSKENEKDELIKELDKFPEKYKVIFINNDQMTQSSSKKRKQEDGDDIEYDIKRTNLKSWDATDCEYHCIYKDKDGVICFKERVRFAETYFNTLSEKIMKSKGCTEAILYRTQDNQIILQRHS